MPMGAWLKGELAPTLDRLLSPEALKRRGWFDHPAVSKLVDEHRNDHEDRTDALLALMNLEIWARIFLDGRTPDDVADELRRQQA